MRARSSWSWLALGVLLVASCGEGEPNQIALFESDAPPPPPEISCEPGIVCAAPHPYCFGKVCVECLTDNNCGNKFCDPSSHTCVECVTSGDCKLDKPYCSGHRCRQCLVAENCGDEGLTCDTREGRCVPACQSSEQCAGPESVCHPNLGMCVACAEDVDCPPDRSKCEAFKCVACRSNEDCDPARPVCDPDKLDCVECLVDADCDAERSCSKRKCE